MRRRYLTADQRDAVMRRYAELVVRTNGKPPRDPSIIAWRRMYDTMRRRIDPSQLTWLLADAHRLIVRRERTGSWS